MSEIQDSSKPLAHDDAAVLKHMELVQHIISTMANTRAVCKSSCIVLVSAFLARAAFNAIHWNATARENLV